MQPSKKATTMKAANEITDSYSYEITYSHQRDCYTVDEYKNGKYFTEHGEYETREEAADGLQTFL